MEKRQKRAITLAGGGPAAGLHIGALKALQKELVEFDVWALSCIGAWVGIVYNQWSSGDKAQRTYEFFHEGVFRDDESYSRFPINTVFGPDLGANTKAVAKFLSDPDSYAGLVLPPAKIAEAFKESLSFWSNKVKESFNKGPSFWFDPEVWGNDGDFNHWMLDQVLAVHPFSRFWTSLLYLSQINGLSRIYYPDSSFLKAINFDNLFKLNNVFIYHNAWNLTRKQLELFSNIKFDGYNDISAKSLCACSALPFIEETVKIDDQIYCEGALVDTVNFSRLLKDHCDLDEIWVSRIVDVKQVTPPENIKDGLSNLCMLFAGALGDDDVKLFRYKAREEGWEGAIYEIDVATGINFDWSQSNLKKGHEYGYAAATELLNAYYSIKYYLAGDIAKAVDHAKKLKRNDYPLGLVARALTAEATREAAQARQEIARLLMTNEGWSLHPDRELGKTFFAPAIREHLLMGLRAAGLPGN